MNEGNGMRRILLVCLLMISGMTWAQNCDQVVFDGANVLNGREQEIQQAAQDLIKEGADVRVRIVPSLVNGNLDFNEKEYEQSCPSWSSPNGNRKNNLVSLMVAPKERKLGIYYGSDYHAALDNTYSDIKKSMGARFASGEWAQGFITGEKGVVGAIESRRAYDKAKVEEAIHPRPAVVNNVQPTDYSGLWTVMKWLIGLSGLGFLIWWVSSLFGRWQAEKNKLESAQSMAMDYKNRAGQRISRIDADKLSAPDKATFDTLVEQYSNACGTVKGDPSVDGQTLAAYSTQLNFYRNLYNELIRLEAPRYANLSSRDSKKPDEPRPKPRVVESVREPEPPPPPPPVRERTVIVQQPSNDGFVEGALLGSLLNRGDSDRGFSRRDEEEERPSYHSHSHDDDSSSSSSGGGSSDWGSSDSGGGGSSDFGGGDSGGGGSSDF
jgi:uncharacterized membrane protein YgcG